MRTTLATTNARIDTLEALVLGLGDKIDALVALNTPQEPAKTRVPAPEADDKPFVEWIRETAPARKARKADNAELAAWLRSKDLTPNGAVWAAAKAGNRSVRSLRAIAKKDAA